MKILHISTSAFGGAAIAAIRQHKALLEHNIQSDILFLYADEKVPNHYSYFESRAFDLKDVFFRLIKRAGFKTFSDRTRKKVNDNHIPCELFTLPFTDFFVEDLPLINDYDIINLHSVADFINYPSFFKKINKPVVWTLHDQNLLFGGFHYEGDFRRNINDNKVTSIEEKLRTAKVKAISGYKHELAIVTPSHWLSEYVMENSFYRKFFHSVIPYSLDIDIFKRKDKLICRNKLGLPPDKKIILFVSDSTSTYRKGFDILLDSVKDLKTNGYVLLTVGAKSEYLENMFPDLYELGSVSDKNVLAEAYSASDVFVLPSREDNLPNVMLEALCCGLPVIAFRRGGMADIITEADGILVDELNSDKLQEAILDVLTGKVNFDNELISENSRKLFNPGNQAKAYLSLYKSLVGINQM